MHFNLSAYLLVLFSITSQPYVISGETFFSPQNASKPHDRTNLVRSLYETRFIEKQNFALFPKTIEINHATIHN